MRPIQSIITGTSFSGTSFDLYYPVPGSGDYQTGTTALEGISYADIGVAEEPSGGIASVTNPAPGLWRSKYDGNFCSGALDTVGAYDLNWFTGNTPIKSDSDSWISCGTQSDGPGPGQHNFSLEWKGYLQLDSQKWNFYVESDDTCAVWIGSEAVSGFTAANCLVSSSNKSLPGDAATSGASKSLIFNGITWYPIRIWFSEFTGACKFQIYALGEDGQKKSGNDMFMYYNNTTKGFNP